MDDDGYMKYQRGWEEWEMNLSIIFFSTILLLVAIIVAGVNYPEGWREGAFWLGIGLGAITPLGRLIYLIMANLDPKFGLNNDWGCFLGCLFLLLGSVMTVLGPIAGVVLFLLLRGTPDVFFLGFVLSITGGMGVLEMAKSSHALYRDSQK